MRCVAGAGLLMLVGCNQVFGIHKTDLFDAAPDVIEDIPHVKLTWQIADVLPTGGPDPVLVDAPIDPAPTVRYGTLRGPLQDATYSPADGSVSVLREFFQPQLDGGLPIWRLEYTLAGGVAHEVQWSPEDKHGQLTVPLFGRAARKAVPTGGGYTVTPDGAPVGFFQSPRMFTSGQWSEGLIPNYTGADAKIDYDFGNAAAMSGGRARPEPTLGDRAFLIDYAIDANGCRYANGSAALDSAALEPGMHSPRTATWDAGTTAVTSEPLSFTDQSRFLDALGLLHKSPANPGALSGTFSLGIAASLTMPPLTGVTPSAALPVLPELPTPVMITVLQCPFDVTRFPDTHQPMGLAAFPRMLNVQLVSKRTVLGVALASGMETAIASTSSVEFKLTFPAAIPTHITLQTPRSMPIALDGADEGVDIHSAAGALTLAFTPDSDEGSADYYDVTLFEIANGALTPRRIYTVTTPQVAIDGAVISPGATYVFEIRSFKGHPGAPSADFRPVKYPYGSALVFTRTFHAS